MSDGLNEARAMRVAEIISDFRNLQHYIAQINASPSAEEYYLEGYALLRQCAVEAQSVLAQPFSASAASPRGDSEMEKQQLRSILYDAAVRRFQSHRTYLRATAAMRWINSRNGVLRGQKPHAGHTAALQQVDSTLRAVCYLISSPHPQYCVECFCKRCFQPPIPLVLMNLACRSSQALRTRLLSTLFAHRMQAKANGSMRIRRSHILYRCYVDERYLKSII